MKIPTGIENVVKTPLGIMALFVLLVEAVAAIALATAPLSNLNQTLLVLFVIFFPCILIYVFRDLVVNHNVRLYAPSEFPNEGEFLAANEIDPARVIQKFKDDIVEEIEKSGNEKLDPATRGNIEEQASEYVEAVDFMKSRNITSKEFQALVEIAENNLSNVEIEKRYDSEIIEKLNSKGLITAAGATAAGAGVGAAIYISEVAKVLLKLF